MSWQYIEVNGVKVLRKIFNDPKTEQEFRMRFPIKPEPGFILVHQWQPGKQRISRSDESYISAIDFFMAPVVDGKPDTNLGAEIVPGQTVAAPENLNVPVELNAMVDTDLLSIAPRIGARCTPKMPRPQLLAACARAAAKNPKNWAEVKHSLAENKIKRDSLKPASVTA